MIISTAALLWVYTVVIFAFAVIWGIWDGRLLRRLWNSRKENHDEFFGGIMGFVILAIGVSGVILHHLSLRG